MSSLREDYTKLIADHLSISVEDLTAGELDVISFAFSLFIEKLEDIKILNDDITRISVELANLKASLDDSSNSYDDEENN